MKVDERTNFAGISAHFLGQKGRLLAKEVTVGHGENKRTIDKLYTSKSWTLDKILSSLGNKKAQERRKNEAVSAVFVLKTSLQKDWPSVSSSEGLADRYSAISGFLSGQSEAVSLPESVRCKTLNGISQAVFQSAHLQKK